MSTFTKITGNQSIAGFVDIYNSNNEAIESEINEIKKRLSLLETNYKKKVDRTSLETIISKEVIRAIDVDYNKEAISERKFARIEDVKEIFTEMINMKLK